MKKFFAIFFIFLFLLSGVGCNGVSDYLTEENGQQYLILPTSKQKVRVDKRYKQHLENIDVDLLENAEEKITEEIAQYNKDREHFYLEEEDGHLLLCVEVIVNIEDPTSFTDHEHKFFKERITK